MVDRLVEIKNNTVKKFGPVLGYVILIAGALALLSVGGALLHSLIPLVRVLARGAIVVFGAYQLYDLLSAKTAG